MMSYYERSAVIPKALLAAMLHLIGITMGCAAQSQPDYLQDPKVVAMRSTLAAVAVRTIEIEERWHGGRPRQLAYMVAIAPNISDGYFIGGTTVDVPGYADASAAFEFDADTIGRARNAFVAEAVLGADGNLYSGTYLFRWQNGRWASGAEVVLQRLKRADPKAARRLDELMNNFGTDTDKERRPLTTQASPPS